MTRRAVIVGSGIAGLSAAIALRRIGWEVVVLERSVSIQPAGAGLSLAPNALRGLDALGVGTHIREIGVPTAAASSIRRPDGTYLVRTQQSPETLPLRAYERSRLMRALLDAVPPDTVWQNSEVIKVLATSSGVVAKLRDREVTGDIVIAADGIHSAVRRQWWAASAETFLNYGVWVGMADLEVAVGPGIEGLDGSMTLGVGRYFLIHPIGPSRVYWALGERADRPGVRTPNELNEVLARVGKWHDPIPYVLAKTTPETVRRLDIHEVSSLDAYVNGRIVLIGDAAHAMSPDRGQGAGQGIEDAVVLASLLAGTSEIDSSLHQYDTVRRPRSQMIVRDAHRVGQTMINAGPALNWFMGAMLRAMPATLWEYTTRPDGNPIWGWKPPVLPFLPRS